jgi:hypothetical protein
MQTSVAGTVGREQPSGMATTPRRLAHRVSFEPTHGDLGDVPHVIALRRVALGLEHP